MKRLQVIFIIIYLKNITKKVNFLDTFFWFSVAGLVASLIILLLIFLLYPGDSSPPVLGRNGASSITIKTMIGENDLKRETSINSKNTTCKFQAKINLIPIKQKRKTIPRITKSS